MAEYTLGTLSNPLDRALAALELMRQAIAEFAPLPRRVGDGEDNPRVGQAGWAPQLVALMIAN